MALKRSKRDRKSIGEVSIRLPQCGLSLSLFRCWLTVGVCSLVQVRIEAKVKKAKKKAKVAKLRR